MIEPAMSDLICQYLNRALDEMSGLNTGQAHFLLYQLQLIEPTIRFFLVTYVFPDYLFTSTHCRYKIASCPEMLMHKSPLQTKINLRNCYDTFTFDIPNYQ
jgi:hypothetical protein